MFCKESEFTCYNSECIPKDWKCDGEDNCDNSSDENNCPGEKNVVDKYFFVLKH